MINKELLDYIKKSKEVGHTNEEIKLTLSKNGWQESNIKEAIDSINNIESNNNYSKQMINQKTASGRFPYWLKGGVIALLLVALFMFILFLFAGDDGGFFSGPYWLYPLLMLGDLAGELGLYKLISSEEIVFLAPPIIIYFLIGAFLGWGYGKLKKFHQHN